jgi:isochorismate pyruvate lyase
MQNQTKTNKEKCQSLSQAREKIDAIDQSIIELIAIRQHYVDQAVRFKRTVQDVQSPERVEQVIQRVREMSIEQSLDPALTERIYRDLIQHFVQRELKEIRP